ncbi:hypothetical protein [Thalassospira alkalitolerans]|uniref:hypothetical protein n=1 Tax=Thalassospira alkalitolerans TaxID=1293890 RepID=UPI003AA90CF8
MTIVEQSPLKIAEASAHAYTAFCENLFSNSKLSDAQKRRVLNLVKDPFWRPICELRINGMTSFEGGLMLVAAKLAWKTNFKLKTGPAAGQEIEVVNLHLNGMELFMSFIGGAPGTKFSKFLLSSIKTYAVVDMGAGIVASEEVIQAAIQNDDWALLTRMRAISDRRFMFHFMRKETNLTNEERAEYLEDLQCKHSDYGARTGARIVDVPRGLDIENLRKFTLEKA